MKGLCGALATLVTVSSFLLPALQASALPVQPDYPCYMRTTAGRVIDLTPSMCGGGQSQSSSAKSLQTTGSAFPSARASATTATDALSYDSRYRSVRTETRGGVTRTIAAGPGDDLSDARDRTTVTSPGIGSYGDTYYGNGSSGRGSSSGNCDYASDIAADGSRCGGRAASERAGGR